MGSWIFSSPESNPNYYCPPFYFHLFMKHLARYFQRRWRERERMRISHSDIIAPIRTGMCSILWVWLEKQSLLELKGLLFQGLWDEAFPYKWSANNWHKVAEMPFYWEGEKSVDSREYFVTEHFNQELPKSQPKRSSFLVCSTTESQVDWQEVPKEAARRKLHANTLMSDF